MSDVLEPTATTQDWAGPQTHDEANCYHQGFLGGLTAYARERGDSTLKSQNPLLARLMDEQGWATIERFEKLKPQEISEALQKKMQNLMYYLTKEAARTSYREFLEFLDINEDEYIQIKSIANGAKPFGVRRG